MNRASPISLIGLALLGALNLASATALYRAATSPDRLVSFPVASSLAPATEIRSAIAINPPPIEAYEQVIARPVFFKSRSPWIPPPAVAAPVPARPSANTEQEAGPEPGDPSLRAVVLAAAVHKALVSTEQQPEGSWLKEGETVGGWEIISIDSTSATLRRGDKKKILKLYTDDPGPNGQN
ncbi:MAG: hypothetical protein KDJ20_03675 [Hyphomicrobiales bacterium]|nr:hypothetical protein [Hyphomicrobiales bacterium]MCC2109830.1 hypothetical protein [Hyphomicrobiales bacterium]